MLRFALGVALATMLLSLAHAENMEEAHEAMAKGWYVSAKQCGSCHPEHFYEWAASPHSYAQLSPIFSAMNRTILKKTNGTMGDFCIRCHTPVGMDMGEKVLMPNLDRHPISLEGVTCVSCHRRKKVTGKTSGRFNFARGDIFEPVYGPFDGDELQRVLRFDDYDVNTKRGQTGRNIHTKANQLADISSSKFCASCHDVVTPDGFRIEETFSDYQASPKSEGNHTCQDCHMGTEPGKPSGYEFKPIAIVGGKPTKPRKHTNHRFVGPDHSVVHPGIFPHNVSASQFATKKEWITFDYKAGWGTDDFEFMVEDESQFPERWQDASDRYEARDYIDKNLETLRQVAEQRLTLFRNGYALSEISAKFNGSDINFSVEVGNSTYGHSVPTGADAERLVYLRVRVIDGGGQTIYLSGDTDPNGDLRDIHSSYVHAGEVPRDEQLFNLQSKFLVKMLRGGEREQVLPVNFSQSPLPWIRPPTQATSLKGKPYAVRKHRKSIPPGGTRTAEYSVSEELLEGRQKPYTITVELVAGMLPVHLVREIYEVGFPYNMSAREVADAVVAGHQVVWSRTMVLDK